MPETSPVARSPITPTPPEVMAAGWAVSGRRSSATLTLTDHTPLAKAAVKASWDGAMAEVLGVRLGRAARESWELGGATTGVLVTGSGPGEWLVLAPARMQDSLAERLEKTAARVDELVTVLDLTHGRALVRLAGARSAELLAKDCAIDLSEAICPNGCALRSAVAGVATDLVRDDLPDGSRSYLLHCERASGQYLFDSLLDAGREFGVEADGFVAPGI